MVENPKLDDEKDKEMGGVGEMVMEENEEDENDENVEEPNQREEYVPYI